ncbi:MAG: PAS domain S-box protein [Actinobacteria bacterium]|nr:PAS domain S-box protein [Actinomycetota bacterium]
MSTPEAREPTFPRQYYETLVEASPTAIVACDPQLNIMSWNPAAERLFGYAQAEALGRHIDELVARHESIRAEAAAVNERVFEEPVRLVTRRTRKDGSLVDVVIRSVPITIDDRSVGAFTLYEDVGELVRQRRFFESLVEQSPAAIVMIDDLINVTLWNPGAEHLFGYPAAEAIGQNLDDLIAKDPELHAEATAWSAEGMAGDSFHRIGRRTRKDGSLVDVEIVAVSVRLEGEPIGFYIIYHDVTELEQTRRRLEARSTSRWRSSSAPVSSPGSSPSRSRRACSAASRRTNRSSVAGSPCCSPTWSGSRISRRASNRRSWPRC